MNSIFVVSADVELLRCVQTAVGSDAEVTRCRLGDALPASTDQSNNIVVIDWRGRDRATLVMTMSRARKSILGSARCVAIVSALRSGRTEVITTAGADVAELVVLESESIADIIRGFMNDPSRTDAAAVAIAVLVAKLPGAAHGIVADVIGSGFALSSVKRLSAMRDIGRDSMTESLRKRTRMTAETLVELAKASFAALLLRDSHFAIAAIARKVGYADERPLSPLCERVWGLSASEIRGESSSLSSEQYLARLVDRFLHTHADVSRKR